MMPRFMTRMMHAVLYPCRDVTALVSQSLDRDMSFGQRLRLRVHFLICVLCRRYHDQVRFLHDTLRRFPERIDAQETPGSPGLSTEAKIRIKRALSSP